MKENRYTFGYSYEFQKNVNHTFLVDEGATPEDIREHFYDFLSGVYGWDVRKYFEGDDA